VLFLHVYFLKSSRVNSKSQLFPAVEGVDLGRLFTDIFLVYLFWFHSPFLSKIPGHFIDTVTVTQITKRKGLSTLSLKQSDTYWCNTTTSTSTG
jgi:hypothetical protein